MAHATEYNGRNQTQLAAIGKALADNYINFESDAIALYSKIAEQLNEEPAFVADVAEWLGLFISYEEDAFVIAKNADPDFDWQGWALDMLEI